MAASKFHELAPNFIGQPFATAMEQDAPPDCALRQRQAERIIATPTVTTAAILRLELNHS